MEGVQKELLSLNLQIDSQKKQELLSRFRELAQPIDWAPVLTDDLKNIRLETWIDEFEQQEAKHVLIEELGMSKEVKTLQLPGPGLFLHLDGSDLYLTCNYIEHLPVAIKTYGLKIEDRSSTVEKIDRKIEALNELRKICSKLVLVK